MKAQGKNWENTNSLLKLWIGALQGYYHTSRSSTELDLLQISLVNFCQETHLENELDYQEDRFGKKRLYLNCHATFMMTLGTLDYRRSIGGCRIHGLPTIDELVICQSQCIVQ